MMVNEHDIIRIFRQKFGINSAWDDVERIQINNTNLAINIDTLAYNTDVPPSMSLREAARKSMIACASDFAAKGIKPLWALISISMPPTYHTLDFEEIAGGLADASTELGCSIVGGDTKQSTEMSITVCLVGRGRQKPYRYGAQIHDAVFVSGPFGASAAGLHMLLNSINGPDEYIRSVLHPTVRLEFGAKIAEYINASMDSSDGLSTTLNEISAQSGISIIVTHEPIADNIEKFARKNNLNMDDLLYNGGEEYEIVFTAASKYIPKICSIASETDTPLIQIGFVEEGSGVFVKKDGQSYKMHDKGWQSFRS